MDSPDRTVGERRWYGGSGRTTGSEPHSLCVNCNAPRMRRIIGRFQLPRFKLKRTAAELGALALQTAGDLGGLVEAGVKADFYALASRTSATRPSLWALGEAALGVVGVALNRYTCGVGDCGDPPCGVVAELVGLSQGVGAAGGLVQGVVLGLAGTTVLAMPALTTGMLLALAWAAREKLSSSVIASITSAILPFSNQPIRNQCQPRNERCDPEVDFKKVVT